LPKQDNCPLSFLQDVIEGKKQLMPSWKLRKCKVPRWPEFAVAKMWTHAITNPYFVPYMPSTWGPGGRTAERAYFFRILATVEGEWLWENIARIRSERTLRGL
jgi:hypothetical protein